MSTGKATGATPTNCAAMEASAATVAMVTPKMLAKLYTIMRTNKVPFLGTGGAKYAFVTHPYVIHDLRNHPDWMEAHKYTDPEPIFKGEVGMLHGFRIIDYTLAPISKDDGYANKAGTASFASFAFGKGAFAKINPGNGNFRMIVKGPKEIGGPLEQWSTIGYKGETGQIVKYPERLYRVMSTTTFSAIAQDNY